MSPINAVYSGKSTLALVARVSAFSVGVVYGSVKLKAQKIAKNARKKAEAKEAKAHH